MITFTSRILAVPFVVSAIFSTAPESLAVSAILNGVYSGAGTPTEVLVVNGRPGSNAILNNHQAFSDSFVTATDSALNGAMRVTYSFVDTNGESIFTVSYFNTSDDSLLLTFTSTIKVEVLADTNTQFRTSTEWKMDMQSESFGNIPLSSETIIETYLFNLTTFTCVYTYAGGGDITLNRSGTGTGLKQGSPLIPKNPNWTRSTPLNFPIIRPNSTIWCDPPFAGSFEYKVAPGRKERLASITLPKGFGSKIVVLAQPSAGGALQTVGTYNSGTKINLLAKSGLKKGTKSVLIRGIKPTVDLKKKAPYPVGLTFTGLSQSAAKLLIKGK